MAAAAGIKRPGCCDYNRTRGCLRHRTQPRILRPPAPVEVKKAGRFAFVQTLPLGYNQGKPSPVAAPTCTLERSTLTVVQTYRIGGGV